ncbi:ZFAT protein, partial [Polypterus senegalus]
MLILSHFRLGQTQLKIFTCEYCNKVFKFKHSLQAHLRIHTNEKPFKCPHCDYASAIKANLSVHLRKHTGEKFSCEYCSFSCLSKGHLKVHVERVHKKIKQHCRFCKKKYSDVKNLLKHVRESHDMVDKKVKDNYDELCLQTREGKRQLLYDCHICDRKFKNELDRDRHMMVHGDERPYACELCDHGVTKFQALEAHIRKHPFIYLCGVCLNKFVSSVRLRSHLKDVHPDLEESIIFGESINQSFCLLEPGGDIQPDSLNEHELQITEELTLLKTQNALVEELVATDEFSGKENVHSLTESCQDDHVLVQEAVCTEVREITEQHTPVLPGDKVQDNRVMTIDGHVVSEECTDTFNQESTVDSTDNQPSSKENNSAIVENSQPHKPVVNILPLESMDKRPVQNQLTLSINYHSTGEEVLSKKEPENSGNYEVISETLQMTEKNILSDPDEQDNNKLASDSPVQYAAFKKILDGMQKRQLNRDLFERIRKVYGDLECEYCGKLFWYQVHYDMHIRTHTREHLYYCSQCSYSSITKNCLKRHVIQKHSNILLKCPTEGCEYTTPDKYKLQAHLKIHTELDKRNYNCPVCMKSFPEDRLIKSHIKTNHPGLKPFKCSLCDYATRSKSNLKAHMNRHNTEKTHLCDMCGKKFKSKSTLKSHKLLHTADGRQFKCTVCDYTAAQKPQLLRHMEQHAYFKPFRCAHCHYSCNISGSLKRHYNRKHPNEQYANAGMGPPAVDVLIQQAVPYGSARLVVKQDNKEGPVRLPTPDVILPPPLDLQPLSLISANIYRSCKRTMILSLVVESAVEESSTQYLHTAESEDLKGTEAAVAALQDLRYNTENGDRLDPTAVNILQQIIEMGAENHEAAVASVVAMAPGTVTVVEQVAEEQQQTDHAVMIQEALQQASVELGEEHHLVVSSDDMEGIETVTVYTQGEDASEFIVYVQEAVQAEEEQTVETL